MDNVTFNILVQTQYHTPEDDADPLSINGIVKIISEKSPTIIMERPSIDIVIVLDTSGSMTGDAIDNAISSVKYIINNLGTEDKLHLVLYNYSASVLFRDKTKADTEEMMALLDTIKAYGGTNMMAGVRVGKEIMEHSPFSNKHMFIFTDGLVNDGIKNPITIYGIISGIRQDNNINVSTFGLGTKYDGVLISKMATTGAGCYYYIDSPANIESSFSEAFNIISTVLYKNTQLRLVGTNGSTVKKIYGFVDGNVVNINQIYGNDTKIYVFEMEVVPCGLPFLTVELVGVDSASEESVSKSFEAVATLTDSDVDIIPIDEIKHRKNIYIVGEKHLQIMATIKYPEKRKHVGSLVDECLELLEPIKDMYSEAEVLYRIILVEKERLVAGDYDSIVCMSPQITSCTHSSQPYSSMRSMGTF